MPTDDRPWGAQHQPRVAALRAGWLLSAAVVLLAAGAVHAAPQQTADDIDSDEAPNRVSVLGGSTNGAELDAALGRLAKDPRNIPALMAAGEAALRIGDTQAAVGFFTRADQVQPDNGRIKGQIGSALVLAGEPAEALGFFEAAEKSGGDAQSFASDRALAYDLVGDNRSAQRWYQAALARGGDDETTRRYALSLAIAGDSRNADRILAPLLQRQDRAAWRVRTFALAINGYDAQAIGVARAMMPADLADGIAPYLRYMPRLTRAQQAAAAMLGRFPRAADIGHDDDRIAQYVAAHPEIGRGLVPVGRPLGTALASADDTARVSRATRRRPGQDDGERSARAPVNSAIDADLTAAPVTTRPAATTPDKRKAKRGKGAQVAAAPPEEAPVFIPPPPPPPRQLAVAAPAVRSVLDGPPGTVVPNVYARQIAPASRPPAPVSVAPPSRVAVSPLTALPPPTSARPTGAIPATGQPVLEARAPSTPPVVLTPPPSAYALQGGRVQIAPARPVATGSSAGPSLPTPTPTPAATEPPPLPAPASPPVARAVAPPPATVVPAPTAAPATATSTVGGSAGSGLAGGFDLARLGQPGATTALVPSTGPQSAPAAASPVGLTPSAAPSGPGPSSVAPPALAPSNGPDPSAAPPAPMAAPSTPPVTFGAAFGTFAPPAEEARATVAAVDLSRIKPARPRAVAAVTKAARGERPDAPTASRTEEDDPALTAKAGKKGAKKGEAADAKEAAKDDPKGGKKGKRGVPANPSRVWVQLATAPNRDGMNREWQRLMKQAPVLKKREPWITPWNRNYRLLVGPLADDDAAQELLNALTKEKISAFIWTSQAGQAVDKLAQGK